MTCTDVYPPLHIQTLGKYMGTIKPSIYGLNIENLGDYRELYRVIMGFLGELGIGIIGIFKGIIDRGLGRRDRFRKSNRHEFREEKKLGGSLEPTTALKSWL